MAVRSWAGSGWLFLALTACVATGCSAEGEVGGEVQDDRGVEGIDRPAERPTHVPGRFVNPPAEVPPTAVNAYAHLDPLHVVPKVLLDRAVSFFDANQSEITNRNVLTVVDFKRHSGQKRFFVIDMKSGVVRAHVVAHGKMSDPDASGFATSFSNVPESNKSSIGFAITGETYVGAHGRSLRLEGLSPTNSNMFDRAIVVHSADYVVEGQSKQGRSLGCFVLDDAVKDDIIDLIRGGSLIYADLS